MYAGAIFFFFFQQAEEIFSSKRLIRISVSRDFFLTHGEPFAIYPFRAVAMLFYAIETHLSEGDSTYNFEQ